MDQRILVTGATGKVGLPVVRELVGRGLAIRALTRDPNRAVQLRQNGVEIVAGDLGRPVSLNNAIRDITHVLLCSSPDPRMAAAQSSLVDAARRSGVRHIVKLSMRGAAADSPVSMLRWHWEAEQTLERSGLSWTHLRPAYFMQNTLGFAPTIRSQGAFFAAAKRGRAAMIDVRDVAHAAVSALVGQGHEGKAYELTGPEALSMHDVADRIGTVLRKQIIYVDQPPAKLTATLMEAEVPDWLARDLTALFEVMAQNKMALVSSDVQSLTGNKPASFDRFVEDYAGVFRGL